MTNNPNFVGRVSHHRIDGDNPDDWEPTKQIVRTIYAYYYHNRDDKTIVTTTDLISGVQRDTNKRWWRYEDTGVTVIKRGSGGFLYCRRKFISNKPKYSHWYSVPIATLNSLDKNMLNQIYGGFFNVFPHAHNWNLTEWEHTNFIPAETNAPFQSQSVYGVSDKLFGIRRSTDDWVDAVIKTSPIHLVFAHYLRGLVSDKLLLEFMKNNHIDGPPLGMQLIKYKNPRLKFKSMNWGFFKRLVDQPVNSDLVYKCLRYASVLAPKINAPVKDWDMLAKRLGGYA